MSLGISMPLEPAGPLDRMRARHDFSRSVDLQESAEMIRQGSPGPLIRGIHGTRMMAYGMLSESAVVGQFPKITSLSHQPARNPAETLAKMDGDVLQGVAPHLFTSELGVRCRVLGALLPPDPAPFTVSHLGGDQWLVRGGPQTFVNKWIQEPADYESVTTLTLDDARLSGSAGWIVMTAIGSQANPHLRNSNFVPSSFEFELLTRLSTDFTFTLEPEPGSSSASRGYYPIAWVAAPGAAEAGAVIFPAGQWGNPVTGALWPEQFNYADFADAV